MDPRQQTRLAFGERSHWLQPWRAYLDTPPATRLRDAIGINFNVEPAEADATARLLADSGFHRARVEFGWSAFAYEDPSLLSDPQRFRTILGALRRHGIRPLILLNAHHGAPGPTRFFSARLAGRAAAGARRVRLDAATARQVEPGRTGLNSPSGKAADVLFTSVSRDNTARLSKPLPRALGAGEHGAATLRYAPFGPPRLPNGRRNPAFERTLEGWLTYATDIARRARAVLGDESFDLEVWNEQSFGSDFLSQDRYYRPPRERGRGDVTREILARTVSTLRREFKRIGIGDGFATQTPFPSGATVHRGLTALDKHPYYATRRFPASSAPDATKPLDALGRQSYSTATIAGKPLFRDSFVPRYDAFFPEYILSGIQTETLIRDLSPITTRVYGTPHGRRAHPPGGRAPAVWITEAALDPKGANPADPGAVGSGPAGRIKPGDVRHLHAKAALRYYTAFVNKGVSAVHLFAAKGGRLALIDPSFFSRAAKAGGAYPGAAVGGEVTRAVGRLGRAVSGARRLRRTKPLSLQAVSDTHGHKQFDGDGTRAHPPLFDRDVVAFFPFEIRPGRYVASVYVMTRDLATVYKNDAPESDPSRYDMPPAPFTLTIGGLGPGHLKATATDPLTGHSAPVKIVARMGSRAKVQMALTDSPRLLSLVQ